MSYAPFVPLRVFSAFTMLEGAIDPKAIAKHARKLGFPAVALCDRNGLYGAMEFSAACVAAGVQPIIGAFLSIKRPERPDQVPNAYDWIALYAQNEVGYQNLCALVSAAHLDRPDHEPAHVTVEQLAARSDGLIALSGGAEGCITRHFEEGQPDAALTHADLLAQMFKGRFYIELSRRLDPIEGAAEADLIELAHKLDLPLVATNPAFYAEADFHDAHDAMHRQFGLY
jgi:DNA polymerase III subunit alpha